MFNKSTTEKGFTLIELLAVIIVVGILSAFAVPTFLAFTNSQRLNSAQGAAFSAIKEAQSRAKRGAGASSTFQVSFAFRSPGSGIPQQVMVAVHPNVATDPDQWEWKTLTGDFQSNTNVEMRGVSPSFTSGSDDIDADIVTGSVSGPLNIRRIRFQSNGTPFQEGAVDKIIVLRTKNGSTKRRCLQLTTLLGNIKQETEADTSCN